MVSEEGASSDEWLSRFLCSLSSFLSISSPSYSPSAPNDAVALYLIHLFLFLLVTVLMSLILLIFVSQAKVVADEYDEYTYCVYASDASTVYGLTAFGMLLLSQAVVYGVTRCLCCGKGLVSGSSSTTCAIVFFVLSWYTITVSSLFFFRKSSSHNCFCVGSDSVELQHSLQFRVACVSNCFLSSKISFKMKTNYRLDGKINMGCCCCLLRRKH